MKFETDFGEILEDMKESVDNLTDEIKDTKFVVEGLFLVVVIVIILLSLVIPVIGGVATLVAVPCVLYWVFEHQTTGSEWESEGSVSNVKNHNTNKPRDYRRTIGKAIEVGGESRAESEEG